MKLTKIIILTIIFSIFTFQASALSFSNFTNNGTGAINNANGYFDDPGTAFGYSGNRNVYAVIEDTEVIILEPVSWSSGSTPTSYIAINSSFGTLKDAVVNNGFLYFVDGTTLKKKRTRDITSPQSCESNDTSAGGCITTVATGVDGTLRSYNNVVYYTVGASLGGSGTLWHLDANDNSVNDFSFTFTPAQGNPWNSFAVTTNNSVTQIYATDIAGSTVEYLNICTSTGCSSIAIGNGNINQFMSLFTTTNYVYSFDYTVAGGSHVETLRRISNGSQVTSGYITTNLQQSNRIYIGGQSTIGLLTFDSTHYQTFNSNEAGIDSLPTSPVALTYNLLELSSVQSSYYNNSNIQIVEALQLQFIDNILLWGDVSTNYRWRVDLIDPNNIPILSFTTGACNGLLSCRVTNVITFQPPDTNWTAGTYKAKMYEVNIVDGTSALLITSSPFTVLTNSSPGGSVSPGTGGSGGTGGGLANTDTALNLINIFTLTAFWGFIIWLGIVGSVISSMANSNSGVNGTAVIVVSWLSAIFIALVGLFDPFKIYIIVMSTIIAAVLFRYGRKATVED